MFLIRITTEKRLPHVKKVYSRLDHYLSDTCQGLRDGLFIEVIGNASRAAASQLALQTFAQVCVAILSANVSPPFRREVIVQSES